MSMKRNSWNWTSKSKIWVSSEHHAEWACTIEKNIYALSCIFSEDLFNRFKVMLSIFLHRLTDIIILQKKKF